MARAPEDRSLFDEELPRRQSARPKTSRNAKGSGGSGGRYWAGTPQQRLRVALGMRQAVLKITSYRSGRKNVYKQLLYMSRHGKLDLETETGEIIGSKDALKSLIEDWSERFDTRVRSRDTVHIVLSAPEGTDPEKLKRAVRDFAEGTFADNHSYAFVRHDDCKHPHLHLLVLMRGHNGEKLDPRKYELACWREAYAEKAREHGIELDASPRYARGKGRKGERQTFRHMQERGVWIKRFEQVVNETVDQGRSEPYAPNEFEEAQAATNRRERPEYGALARKYERLAEEFENPAESRFAVALARTFAAYEESMPVPESLRQQMLQASAAQALISPEGAPKAAQNAQSSSTGSRIGKDRDSGPER